MLLRQADKRDDRQTYISLIIISIYITINCYYITRAKFIVRVSWYWLRLKKGKARIARSELLSLQRALQYRDCDMPSWSITILRLDIFDKNGVDRAMCGRAHFYVVCSLSTGLRSCCFFSDVAFLADWSVFSLTFRLCFLKLFKDDIAIRNNRLQGIKFNRLYIMFTFFQADF